MATSIWLWRRTMLEKAQWTARTVSRRFAKLATTSRKYRMHISARVRDAWKACGVIRGPFARNPIRAGASFSQTSEEFQSTDFGNGMRAATAHRSKVARKAGTLA